MKQSPHDRDLSSLLGPSKFSAEGFLGSDPRSPEEIITDDRRTLERLGVSTSDLVDALRAVYEAAEKAFGAEVAVGPDLTATYFESRGKTPSPFRGDGMFPKGEVDVVDRRSGRRFIVTALGISLIAKHGFFQGRGSRYRLDPAQVVEMLGLRRSA